MAVQSSIITRDIDKIAAPTGNLYESVVVMGKTRSSDRREPERRIE